MMVIHDPVDGPLRMFYGTVALVAFLRWVVWLVGPRETKDENIDEMSEGWRMQQRFWVDPR